MPQIERQLTDWRGSVRWTRQGGKPHDVPNARSGASRLVKRLDDADPAARNSQGSRGRLGLTRETNTARAGIRAARGVKTSPGREGPGGGYGPARPAGSLLTPSWAAIARWRCSTRASSAVAASAWSQQLRQSALNQFRGRPHTSAM